MINGIDIASYQPETYPTSGLDFVFIKATEGTSYINPKMARQAATARTAGLAVGFYHFLHPGNILDQARYFVAQCASLEGDMLVCDWETTATGGRPTCAEKDAFLRAVKQLRPTHKVGLYCNTDYWLHRDTTSYAGDFLWIADPNHPKGQPAIKAKWLVHQWGQRGTDQDVAAFSSRSDLRNWCGYPTAPPKPAPKPVPVPPAPKPAPAPQTKDQQQDARLAALETAVGKLAAKLGA
jgi:GH25 family lysozyme M1 (1,4-beta-N-acetylmuramidase)